jgi:hypothetical protein
MKLMPRPPLPYLFVYGLEPDLAPLIMLYFIYES